MACVMLPNSQDYSEMDPKRTMMYPHSAEHRISLATQEETTVLSETGCEITEDNPFKSAQNQLIGCFFFGEREINSKYSPLQCYPKCSLKLTWVCSMELTSKEAFFIFQPL